MERNLAVQHGFCRRLNSWSALAALAGVYAIWLVLLLPCLSLWLDEIVDLRGIRDYDLARLIAWVPINAGGVPLGYLTRFATIHLFGYSTFSARLPSAIFSLLACVGVFILGQRLQLRFPLLAVTIFCLAPLQLRYALESRPYSLALALSIWSTIAFLQLLEKITVWRAFVYGLFALLGLYTMPYTIFVPVAHLVWLCGARNYPNKWRLLIVSGLAVVLAALGFAPWYLWTVHLWNQSLAAGHLRYTMESKAALLVARELVGAGYLGTALVAGLAWFGWKSALPDYRTHYKARLFWFLYTVLPIVLALLADAIFGYFLAIRQMIFVLAPLSLLATLGIERLARRRERVAAAMCSILVAAFLVGDVRFFWRQREDWDAAAHVLRTLILQGSCVAFVPPDSLELYRFFIPELGNAGCAGDVGLLHSVAVAASPYGRGKRTGIETNLSKAGFTKTREYNLQGPKIELYQRR